MSRQWTLAIGLLAAALVWDGGAAVAAADVAAPTIGAPGPPSASSRPAAPHARPVYRSDFAKGVGAEWWPRWTGTTPKGDRTFLGDFGIEPLTFTLGGLPPHKFVRLHLSLFMIWGVDGSSTTWGPDPWELRVLGGPRLLYTTFCNCCFFTDNNEQAFPDDFPWAMNPGWTGAAEKQTLGYISKWHSGTVVEDTSSVYRLTLVFPHEDPDLRLLLRALWSEAGKQNNESWGVESLEVETLDGPLPLTDQDLEALWRDLGGEDAPKAFAALWTLVGGGEKTVDFVRGKVRQPVAVKRPEVQINEELSRLLKDLDDEAYKVREQASRRLREIGRPLLPTLRRLAAAGQSAEVKMRLEEVIAELSRDGEEPVRKPPRPPPLAARAVRVLETIGNPSALELLGEASREADWPASPYAAAARERLAERMLDGLLARADAAGRAGDLAAAEKLCDQAQTLARTSLPEDERRVASVREDCLLRQAARAAAENPADAAAYLTDGQARRAALRRRLAVAEDMAGAARLADDPKVRERLRLAARPPEDLSDDEARGLRSFYLDEARAAEGPVRSNLVGRALAAARPGGEPTTEAFERSRGIDRDLLVAWSMDQANRGRWTDLLPLLDVPMNDKGQNRSPSDAWWREWSGVKSGGTPPPLLLPVRPAGSYQIRLAFIPNAMSTAVLVPVGDRHARVLLHGESGRAAIQVSQKLSVPPPPPPIEPPPEDLMPSEEHQADVTVRQEAGGAVLIRLTVDGRTVAEWRGQASEVEKQADGTPPPQGCPAVIAEHGWTLFRTVALRMLDGTLAPAPAAPAAAPADKP